MFVAILWAHTIVRFTCWVFIYLFFIFLLFFYYWVFIYLVQPRLLNFTKILGNPLCLCALKLILLFFFVFFTGILHFCCANITGHKKLEVPLLYSLWCVLSENI